MSMSGSGVNVPRSVFVQRVAKRCVMSPNEVRRILSAMEEEVAESLRNGESVVWGGWVKFESRDLGARDVVLPGSREPLHVGARKSVVAKVASVFKRRVFGDRVGVSDRD